MRRGRGRRYADGERAVFEAVLAARPGELVAVVAPPGAGKSVLYGLLHVMLVATGLNVLMISSLRTSAANARESECSTTTGGNGGLNDSGRRPRFGGRR